TLGVYGRGCYAISHDYIESGKPALPLVHTHPRAGYSRYFVDKQLKWVSGYAEESSYIRSFIWDKGTYPNAPTREEFKIGSSSEMPCDLHLRYVPITLLYEQLGPILKIFLNDIDNPRPDAISNYLGGSSIDDLDDLTISLALSAAPSVTHWASLIDAPNWIQACPAFNIALSDRSLQNMWTAVYATNAYGLFFGGAEITGTGTYGQLQRPGSYSEEVRAQDWAAFTAIQFPMNNRMTVWHLSNQLGFINSRFSGLDNDEYSALYSGVFSGYTEDLITRYLRVQGYNPDYVYHGTIEHPLDDFNSEYSTAPMGFRGTIYTTQTVNNYDPDVHVAGAPKTPHFVRRHRANDNLLIVVNNWHSGSAPFQGTFDPASYGITNGCQVYDLDVNSSNHGTRTLTCVLEPGETYSLNTTLDQ
ncbi:MAG: hypothetical protein KDH96_12600, partial [Candidatus Riesia sp.]|nr:hypothetical protein [Candidatus Riesia sp.]